MRSAMILLALLCLSGCHALSEQGVQNVEGEVAIHARYRTLIEGALNGTGDPAENVSQVDLDRTPVPVLLLLNRTLRATYDSGGSWQAVAFDVGLGPDPASLPPLAPPVVKRTQDAP